MDQPLSDSTNSVIPKPDALAADRTLTALGESAQGRALGRLSEVAVLLSGWQAYSPPRALSHPRMVVFAGDQGISWHNISELSPESSLERARSVEHGASSAHVLAQAARVPIRLVDVNLDHDAWGEERVSRSCPPIDTEDAMTPEELHRALEIGRRVADSEVDSGADVLVAGEIGSGTETTAAALAGVLTRTEPVALVSPSFSTGGVVDDAMTRRRITVIRDAMFRARAVREETTEILRLVGSPHIAALVGFIEQAARRRTPVLIGDTPCTVAALIAERLYPGVRAWCAASQLSPEKAHAVALEALNLTPLLALDISLGEGAGAVTALPLLQAAGEIAELVMNER